jgi:hypothetical protein
VLGAVFVAEIGDVTRFARPQQLCSWAGMTPRLVRIFDAIIWYAHPAQAYLASGGPSASDST